MSEQIGLGLKQIVKCPFCNGTDVWFCGWWLTRYKITEVRDRTTIFDEETEDKFEFIPFDYEPFWCKDCDESFEDPILEYE